MRLVFGVWSLGFGVSELVLKVGEKPKTQDPRPALET